MRDPSKKITTISDILFSSESSMTAADRHGVFHIEVDMYGLIRKIINFFHKRFSICQKRISNPFRTLEFGIQSESEEEKNNDYQCSSIVRTNIRATEEGIARLPAGSFSLFDRSFLTHTRFRYAVT